MPVPLRWIALGAALTLAPALVYLRARSALHDHAQPAPSASAPAPARSAPPPSRAAGPAELALVAPLVAGSDLGGFKVREIRGVQRGRMRLVCAKDDAAVWLEVALADPEGMLPPATAGRYAIFYALKGATPEDADRLAKRLAKVIASNPGAEPPPG